MSEQIPFNPPPQPDPLESLASLREQLQAVLDDEDNGIAFDLDAVLPEEQGAPAPVIGNA